MAIPDVKKYFIDPSNAVTVTPAEGETITVSAGIDDTLSVNEHIEYRDEVGPRKKTTITHTGSNFATNSRNGETIYQFSRI